MDDPLARLLEAYVEGYRLAHGTLPRQPFEPQWPSPCQVGDPDADGYIAWRPVPRERPADWSGLERALEQRLHPAVGAYFGRYYSEIIPARAEEGTLQLIQIWNDADFERLLANLIGHALAKSRRSEPLTIFFATTDEEELFLSVDNASGRVLLENAGEPPRRQLAPDLDTFLARVQPVIPSTTL